MIEPDIPALRLQTDYIYDAFGQKTQATVSGADIAMRSASVTYDAKDQFPANATNALGHQESWQHDARFSLPISHTGPNGLTTTWDHDEFGRKVLEVRADGTRTTWSYQYCSGVAGGTASCPVGGAYLIQTKVLAPDGITQLGPTATDFHDQLDRIVASDTQGFDGNVIRVSTEYDALGRVARKSRPYFAVGGTPKWTIYTYDALERVLTEAAPDNGTTTHVYDGLVTSTTNALSQTTTTTKDSQGQVAAVVDAQSNVTSFVYDPFGNLTQVTDAAGNITTYTYDTRGRKVAVSDPDMGASTYTYDALDKLTSQTNAASEVTTLSYDLLGRPTQRVEPGLTSTWTWDTATKGIGKLATASTNGGYSRAHSYDSLGRPSQVALTINSATHSITTGYDISSRVSSVTYPSGFAVTYGYNATGYQSQVSNSATSQVYWTANARDAELHLTQQTAGNGVVTSQVFDPNTGMLTSTTAGSAGAVQNQAYTYDGLDKLLTRSDANTSLSESFGYDTLNRLTSSTVSLTPAPLVSTFSYNAIGNLITKSDVGTYTYPAPGQPRPHGVTSIAGGVINTSFGYDAKGNMTSGNGLTVTYTASNKAATITRGTTTVSFDHDPEHQRYSQLSASGLTLYIGGGGVLAERFAGSSTVQWTNYLFAAGQMVGVFVERSDETVATRYFHLDHLGSVSVITDENGIVIERLSYDAWGLRRHPDGAPDPAGAITSQARRGFTGHEHLSEVGLIHMNARVYDPRIARVMSPDIYVTEPMNGQSWNPYSYVGNSPLYFTDPTGWNAWRPDMDLGGWKNSGFSSAGAGAYSGSSGSSGSWGSAGAFNGGPSFGFSFGFDFFAGWGNFGGWFGRPPASLGSPGFSSNIPQTSGQSTADARPLSGMTAGQAKSAANEEPTGTADATGTDAYSYATGENAAGNFHQAQNRCLGRCEPDWRDFIGGTKAARPGRYGGPAHRSTVERRGQELQDQGHTITGGGGRLPERAVITPDGKRRFPDISTRDPSSKPYHENVGRSTRTGEPISREQDALRDIRRATGTEPGYTPYDR